MGPHEGLEQPRYFMDSGGTEEISLQANLQFHSCIMANGQCDAACVKPLIRS
jgi:hypothetical protein